MLDKTPSTHRRGAPVRHLLIRWAVLAVAIGIAVAVTDGIDVHGGVLGYIGVAAVLGLVNALIRPIVRLFSMPLTIATLGLFSLVINAVMLIIAALFSSALSIDSFWDAIVGAFLISIVSTILNWLVTDRVGARRR
jgi:putative membrane protein